MHIAALQLAMMVGAASSGCRVAQAVVAENTASHVQFRVERVSGGFSLDRFFGLGTSSFP